MRATTPEAFWSKVRKGPGCWEWTAFVNKGYGYGRAPWTASRQAHRISWVLHFGPVPPGLLVCHRCDNRICVRPDHLFLGTTDDNMADMVAKGRSASGERNGLRKHPDRAPRGERQAFAKLTTADVLAIRAAKAEGERATKLATKYGVSVGHIYNLCSRQRAWRHV